MSLVRRPTHTTDQMKMDLLITDIQGVTAEMDGLLLIDESSMYLSSVLAASLTGHPRELHALCHFIKGMPCNILC